MAETESKGYYGKRPLWQWAAIYLVIAVILYGAFYYLFLAKKGGYNYNQQAPTSYSTPSVTPTNSATSDTIIMTKTDAAKGDYLVDSKGMTLYTFDKDSKDVSNCYNGCAVAWPPYLQGSNANLPDHLVLITRTDSTSQYTYKGWPLYYYANDSKPGDITGDGVGGTWHLVKP